MSLDSTTRPAPPVARPGTWALLRPLLLRLHFCAGVLIGPFLLVAALSGAAYALSPQVERVVYADLLTGGAPDPTVSLADQVATAEQVTTVDGLVAVRPAPEGGTTRVLFDDGTLAESTRHAVFLDPATGEVLGQEDVYGTSGALPVRAWVSDLHRTLHLGDVGRLYSELAASWLWVVALGGLALWVARARARRSARAALLPDRAATGRSRTRSWHAVLGTWSVLGFLMLSATGLTWSAYAGAHVTDLRAALGWSNPALATSHEGMAVDEHAGHGGGAAPRPVDAAVDPADVDPVWAAAVGAGITSDEVEIALPAAPGSFWTVTEVHRAFPTAVDAAAVDPDGFQVVDTTRFADHPLMAKLARWGVDLHMGVLFGVANQVALAGLALGLAAVVVLGYRMWWQRSRRWPAPAGLGRLPRPMLAGLAVLTVAVGWFLPLLGVSLAAFLAVDVLLARRRRTAGQQSA
ncbi:Uncharacterized iron-regulated membrane protein [Klenkia marina]|uniref:Uncharacterized iron-regulated membrane protein n=1 Tax=Klenkia marina TaxID=1960309 RepID=A0A1G4XHD9_9ACTN|nr:PepSY domain-containing protein [Klenkia marina]SCX40643.1 Uncharacterized iron-regulated membrane protein [Klenkia marina]